MKVCVTAGASGLDAPMDPRFGRCPFFVVVDLESMSENSITNSNVTASSGAGIQAAQEIAKQGISALITGNIGPMPCRSSLRPRSMFISTREKEASEMSWKSTSKESS